MKEKQMRIKCAIIAACIAVTSVFTLFACSSSSNTEGTGNYGITSAKLNDRGELIVEYSDGRQQNLGAISNEGSTIVIEGGESTISTASSVGLASAVSITSHFEMTYRYSYGGFFPGYGGTKTEAYKSEGSGVIDKIDRQTGSAFIIMNYHVVYDSAYNTEDGFHRSCFACTVLAYEAVNTMLGHGKSKSAKNLFVAKPFMEIGDTEHIH